MSSSAYRLPIRPVEDVGFFARLFGRKQRQNACAELWNLVATTPIANIPPLAVEEILERYKMSTDDLKADMLTLYGVILAEACRDDVVSDAEVQDLRQLRNLFGLSNTDVADLASAAYGERLADALKDGGYSDDEKARMAHLAERLRLPADVTMEALKEQGAVLLQRVMSGITADERVSPEEEGQLQALADELGVTLTYDDATQATLDRYRLLWRIDQGDLPRLPVPVNLKGGETCHFKTDATHLEFRSVTRTILYHGPTARIRIAKGVYWRAGAVAPTRVSEQVLTPLDAGTLYITNRRLLFDGSRKSATIPFSRVLNFTPYQDGLAIEKETGKDQFFRFAGEVPVAAAILGTALTRQE